MSTFRCIRLGKKSNLKEAQGLFSLQVVNFRWLATYDTVSYVSCRYINDIIPMVQSMCPLHLEGLVTCCLSLACVALTGLVTCVPCRYINDFIPMVQSMCPLHLEGLVTCCLSLCLAGTSTTSSRWLVTCSLSLGLRACNLLPLQGS